MNEKKLLDLNFQIGQQLSDKDLSKLAGGAPGVPCSGGGCKGSSLEANVDKTLKNLREVNPPTPSPPPGPLV